GQDVVRLRRPVGGTDPIRNSRRRVRCEPRSRAGLASHAGKLQHFLHLVRPRWGDHPDGVRAYLFFAVRLRTVRKAKALGIRQRLGPTGELTGTTDVMNAWDNGNHRDNDL